jgi:NAD(P)-dependent dehydrogenase (short-subunit alcohol dehydrogenase family)
MDSILEESGQPRLIRAEEVAEVIMPLLSEDASETNGQLVVIDGKDSP